MTAEERARLKELIARREQLRTELESLNFWSWERGSKAKDATWMSIEGAEFVMEVGRCIAATGCKQSVAIRQVLKTKRHDGKPWPWSIESARKVQTNLPKAKKRIAERSAMVERFRQIMCEIYDIEREIEQLPLPGGILGPVLG